MIYGEPRATKDIDVTLGIGLDRVDDALEFVRSSGWILLTGDPAVFAQQTGALPAQDPKTGIRIDLIFSWMPFEASALKRARTFDVGGVGVNFVSPEDLIVQKIVAGRPRDLEDIRWVIKKNPNLDLQYVRHWLEQFEDTLELSLLDQLASII